MNRLSEQTMDLNSLDFGLTANIPGFVLERTSDNSPTLRLKLATGEEGESMHHSGGAATETQYIYGEPLRKVLDGLPQNELRMTVVGLGLGYIEILAAQELLKRNQTTLHMVSYESEQVLRELFKNWLHEGELNPRMQENTTALFKTVATSLSTEVSVESTQALLKKLFEQNLWKIESALTLESIHLQKNHLICFDAFSQKTTADLWTEEFFEAFIDKACDEDCAFTTYACTGVLRRALIKKGFHFIKRPGFFGKRDSTLALRGKVKSFGGFLI